MEGYHLIERAAHSVEERVTQQVASLISPDNSPIGQTYGQIAALTGIGLDKDGEAGEEGARSPQLVPGLGQVLEIDDHNAILVLVLPKIPENPSSTGSDSSADSDVSDECTEDALNGAFVENPFDRAARIFRRSDAACFEIDGFSEQSYVSTATYQRAVRQKLIEAIRVQGLKVSSFESIDKDVMFWKVYASLETLQDIAEKVLYQMPYREEVYSSMGDESPKDHEGSSIFAYDAFKKSYADNFQEFTSIDKIRLVSLELRSVIDVDELLEQGVIVRSFPAAKYDELMALHRQWVAYRCRDPRTWPPRSEDVDLVRNYFGEEIAFFFRFYTFYIFNLGMLSVPALVVHCSHTSYLHLRARDYNTFNAVFGICLILWATWFLFYFEQIVEGLRQRWGIADLKNAEVVLASYDPRLRGKWKQTLHRFVGKLCTGFFLAVFIAVTFAISFVDVPKRVSSVVQTVVIFVFSSLWGQAAKRIVLLENHRTQARFHHSLTMKLALVKLFLYLFPLFKLAFLAPLTQRSCGVTIEEAASGLYNPEAFARWDHHGAAEGANNTEFLTWAARQTIEPHQFGGQMLSILSKVKVVPPMGVNKTCIRGCVPQLCEAQENGEISCSTDCFGELQSSLGLLFVSHAGFTMLFIIIPMVQVRRLVNHEVELGRELSKHEPIPRTYSLLQYQEKSDDQARYEYASWGGSYVEDFLEVILGFAVLVCFGIIRPALVVVGFLLQMVEYRLLAYRMTWVTSRPFPNGSTGIGEWTKVIEVIIYLSMVVNSLLVVATLRTDLDNMPTQNKFLFVSGYFMVMVIVKVLMKIVLHEPARHVVEAVDQNNEFLAAIHRQAKPARRNSRSPTSANIFLGVGDE